MPAASDPYVEHSPTHCLWSEILLQVEENPACRSTTGVMQRSNENAPSALEQSQNSVLKKSLVFDQESNNSKLKGLTWILELIGLAKHDHRRALAKFGFWFQGPT